MSSQQGVSAGAIFAGVGDVAMRHGRIWGLATLFMAVAYTLLDLVLPGEDLGALASFVGGIANFFVTYHVTETLLRSEGLMSTSQRNYASVLGVSILSTLGAGLGFLVLIVPGLYLFARWSIATPLVIAEGRAASDAMAESWRRTASSAWALVAVFAVYTLGVVAMIGLAITGIISVENTGAETAPALFVGNLVSTSLGMVAVLLSVAIYRALADDTSRYEDVFG